MATKKKDGWKNFRSVLLVALTVVIVSSLLIAIPINLANYFHVRFYSGFRVFLLLAGNISAYLIAVKLFGVVKPRPLFTNVRDGIVISLSWLIFFLIAFSPFDIADAPSYLCTFSFPLALAVAIAFSYLFGSDELKLKIKNYPKVFRKKRPRKPKSGGQHAGPTDNRRKTDPAPPGAPSA
ncbi:MAG: hypothetical protein AB1750_13410 [Chloroflexota bacterium]